MSFRFLRLETVLFTGVRHWLCSSDGLLLFFCFFVWWRMAKSCAEQLMCVMVLVFLC